MNKTYNDRRSRINGSGSVAIDRRQQPPNFSAIAEDCRRTPGDRRRFSGLKLAQFLDLDPARPLSTPPPEATTDMTDITGNKQLEKCPCIASLAFEIQEGMMVMDAQKVILRVNPAFTRLTGFGGDEVIGQIPPQLSSGLQDEHFYQRLWQAIADEGYWQGEIRDRRKNGEVFPEWLTVSAILGLDGQIGHYVGSFVDMGAHKRREHDYQAQLQQKNAEWRGTLLYFCINSSFGLSLTRSFVFNQNIFFY